MDARIADEDSRRGRAGATGRDAPAPLHLSAKFDETFTDGGASLLKPEAGPSLHTYGSVQTDLLYDFTPSRVDPPAIDPTGRAGSAWSSAILAGLLMLLALASGCGRGPEEVQIVSQEYRFEPSDIRRQAADPVTLVLSNRGREAHEFTSLLLRDPRVEIIHAPKALMRGESDSLRLLPGRTTRVTLLAPPGTYEFHCRIRGHGGMQGLITLD